MKLIDYFNIIIFFSDYTYRRIATAVAPCQKNRPDPAGGCCVLASFQQHGQKQGEEDESGAEKENNIKSGAEGNYNSTRVGHDEVGCIHGEQGQIGIEPPQGWSRCRKKQGI